ncbi:MAG: PorT family protein [Bacteroidetes bacterium]|nr:PorT family protein [Bacteroidota bacterium]
MKFAKAQTQHNPYYDLRKPFAFHFGFTLGTNFSDAKYAFDGSFFTGDTLKMVDVSYAPGITLGPVVNMHLRERLDIRSVPTLNITGRSINYTFSDATVKNKSIESVYLQIPLLLKYKSERHGNLRFYTIGGGGYGWDIASKEGRVKDPFDPEVTFTKHNYYWTYGCGLDMYFKYFKFSPEITISNNFNNILDFDESIYTTTFSRIRNRMILISFHFE